MRILILLSHLSLNNRYTQNLRLDSLLNWGLKSHRDQVITKVGDANHTWTVEAGEPGPTLRIGGSSAAVDCCPMGMQASDLEPLISQGV